MTPSPPVSIFQQRGWVGPGLFFSHLVATNSFFTGLTLRLRLGLVGVPHHWTVYGADAVVAHVQCCQVSPHGNESRDRTAGLRPLSLPLWELARLRDQDGLEADAKMTPRVARHAQAQILQPSRYHHRLCGPVDTQSSQTRPQRRQTFNLLRAAFTDLRTEGRGKKSK